MKVPLPQLRRHQVRTPFFDLTSNIYGGFLSDSTCPLINNINTLLFLTLKLIHNKLTPTF